MARVNVYLPDALASDVRSSSLNLSALTQLAAREALTAGGAAQTKGKTMEYATQERLNYLNDRLRGVQHELGKCTAITEMKSRRVLSALQEITSALESDRFDEL